MNVLVVVVEQTGALATHSSVPAIKPFQTALFVLRHRVVVVANSEDSMELTGLATISIGMFRVARASFLALTFLSLQLSLFGGGAKCSVAGLFGASRGTTPIPLMRTAGMEMAGMVIADMDSAHLDAANGAMAEMDSPAPRADGETAGAPSPHNDQSCDAEHVNSGCNVMTVCVFAAVTSQRSSRSIQPPPPARVPTLAVRTPPTEGDAPDLPPPRG